MGLNMRSRELGVMRNLSKYLFSRLTGHAELGSSEITTSFPTAELVVLTFMHLNYHETLMERDIASSNSRNIIESEKASETKNIHGNITQLHRVIQIGMADNFMDQIWGDRFFVVNSSSAKNFLGCRPNSLDNNRIVGWRGNPGDIMSPFNAVKGGINRAGRLGLFNKML